MTPPKRKPRKVDPPSQHERDMACELRLAFARITELEAERDEWHSAALNYTNISAEVEAWRVVDRLATRTDAYRKAYDEARRLRAQNEGGER
jgi:hypothetical protein